jgi:cell division protein FtsW
MVRKQNNQIQPDLILVFVSLIIFGFIFLSSSSIEISDRLYGQPYYYLIRQIVYFAIGIMLSWIVYQVNFDTLKKLSSQMIIATLLLLVLVLIVGREINGSIRWLSIAGINIQVSELFKLSMIIYLASYIERKNELIKTELRGLVPPIIVVVTASFLMLLEPDFGATFVVATTALAMMFMAGVRVKYFIAVLLVSFAGLAGLIVASPYRFQRLISFMDPWSDPFNSGFQLSQALIALGRGELFGVGLGASIQKMFYLPEAHTDFVYSVIGEELGVLGTLGLLALFVLLVVKILFIARKAELDNRIFEAFICYGYGFWIGIQMLINIGVNLGVLPTKGLTLPFISYGGSSLIVFLLGMGLVLKVQHRNKSIGEF